MITVQLHAYGERSATEEGPRGEDPEGESPGGGGVQWAHGKAEVRATPTQIITRQTLA